MLERQKFEEIQDPKERATDFLRRSLSSHFLTGPIIGSLRAKNPDFQEQFTLAQTPPEILEAVSASGSEWGIRVVKQFVNKWVNQGNNKNPSPTRQLIASAYESWVADMEEN